MAFIRDRNAKTRGVGAVAALDMVSSAGRRQQRARVMAMARRDGAMARLAMGALDTGARPTRVIGQGRGVQFDYGTTNQPTPPPTRGTIPTSPTPGVVTSPTTGRLTPTRAAQKFTQTFSQSLEPFPGPGNTQTPPPPLPPPPVEVVDTKPPSSSSGGGGGGGGYAGGGNAGGGIVPPEIITEDLPATIEPTTAPKISGKTLALGAAALLAAYYLTKKKA